MSDGAHDRVVTQVREHPGPHSAVRLDRVPEAEEMDAAAVSLPLPFLERRRSTPVGLEGHVQFPCLSEQPIVVCTLTTRQATPIDQSCQSANGKRSAAEPKQVNPV